MGSSFLVHGSCPEPRQIKVCESLLAGRQAGGAGGLFFHETPLFYHTALLWEFSQITIIFLKLIKFNIVRFNSVVKI